MGKFGKFLKKTIGGISNTAAAIIPGPNPLLETIGKVAGPIAVGANSTIANPTLTPKADAPLATLTPKFNSVLAPNAYALSTSTFSDSQVRSGLNATNQTPDKNSMPVWLWILGAVALLFLLPKLLKGKR